MSALDKVAEALCAADGKSWVWLHPKTCETYRQRAQAAIDALGLIEERGGPSDDTYDRNQIRLKTRWVRTDGGDA